MDKLINLKIAVLGCGYVGLPLIIELSKHFSVLGFDLDHSRIEELKNFIDRNGDYSAKEVREAEAVFSFDKQKLKGFDVFIVAVPTPVLNDRPDLSCLIDAAQTVSSSLSPGNCVIIEQAGVTDFAIRLAKENPERLVRMFNRLLESVDYAAYSVEDATSVIALLQIAMIDVGLAQVIKVIGKEDSALEVHVGERTIVLALEYCRPDQKAEQLLQVVVGQLEELTAGMPSRRNEFLRIAIVFSKPDKRITVWSVA